MLVDGELLRKLELPYRLAMEVAEFNQGQALELEEKRRRRELMREAAAGRGVAQGFSRKVPRDHTTRILGLKTRGGAPHFINNFFLDVID